MTVEKVQTAWAVIQRVPVGDNGGFLKVTWDLHATELLASRRAISLMEQGQFEIREMVVNHEQP